MPIYGIIAPKDAKALKDRLGLTLNQMAKIEAVTLVEVVRLANWQLGVQMQSKFNRPTNFVLPSTDPFKARRGFGSTYAKAPEVSGTRVSGVTLNIKGNGAAPSNGVPAASPLATEVFGGPRVLKGSERLLNAAHMGRAAGLARGSNEWVPGMGAPANAGLKPGDKGYDLSGGFTRKILSAMQALENEQTMGSRKTQNALKFGHTGGWNSRALFKANKSMPFGKTPNNLLNAQERELQRQHMRQQFGQAQARKSSSNFVWGVAKGAAFASPRHILYQYDLTPFTHTRGAFKGMTGYRKDNLRPVLLMSQRQESYQARLPFFDVPSLVSQADIQRVYLEQAERLVKHWASK